jgi:ubiquinone/menaquinone biosynthesis C-methylase UbiE
MQTYEELNDLARAFQRSRLVLTAIELDVFTAVGSGAPASAVAATVGANERASAILLNALVAVELLTKQGNVYRNSELAARHLAAGSPDPARLALMHTASLWSRWSTLTNCVRAGTSLAAAGRGEDDAGTRAFIAAMHRNASARAPEVIAALALSGVYRVLDLGGGSGAYSIAFAKSRPELRAEVLDLPEVVPLARTHAREAGLAERVTAREGDIAQESYGEGYDLVWISQICHMMGPDENLAMLRKVHRALAPDGRVAIQEFLLHPNRTGPPHAALFALNMLVGTAHGNTYTEGDLLSWLAEAGFRKSHGVKLHGPTGLVLGTK